MSEEPKKTYTVVSVRDETPRVRTLEIIPDSPVSRRAGQFITVYFPELAVPEGKAYSISSAPHEGKLAITVKAMGTFSNRLSAMRSGDSFLGSEPYGFFYSEERDTPLVMLAAGIGITPFRSLILEHLREAPQRNILLCFGNRTKEDIIFYDEWQRTQERYPSFRVVHFLSREDDAECEKGRMDASRVLALSRLESAEFMLCGSIAFVRDLWRGLRDAGISEERMYTEAFFTN
jgi:ferredoxin-NADP reductase